MINENNRSGLNLYDLPYFCLAQEEDVKSAEEIDNYVITLYTSANFCTIHEFRSRTDGDSKWKILCQDLTDEEILMIKRSFKMYKDRLTSPKFSDISPREISYVINERQRLKRENRGIDLKFADLKERLYK